MSTEDDPVERFVTFDCEGDACVGIVSEPAQSAPSAASGIVIVVGGPQYRVGSHRQFVRLARALARAGHPVLRFDYRGMGDSDGAARNFEAVDADIAAAVTALQRETGMSAYILFGLCDGASAALMYAASDSRIVGVVALNPWARSTQVESAVRLRHYYARRVLSREFWRKALRGRVALRRGAAEFGEALRGAVAAPPGGRGADYLARMQEGWRRFRGPVLCVLSGRDFTAREFEAWVEQDGQRRALLRGERCDVVRCESADHTFSDASARDALTARTLEWLRRISIAC